MCVWGGGREGKSVSVVGERVCESGGYMGGGGGGEGRG